MILIVSDSVVITVLGEKAYSNSLSVYVHLYIIFNSCFYSIQTCITFLCTHNERSKGQAQITDQCVFQQTLSVRDARVCNTKKSLVCLNNNTSL